MLLSLLQESSERQDREKKEDIKDRFIFPFSPPQKTILSTRKLHSNIARYGNSIFSIDYRVNRSSSIRFHWSWLLSQRPLSSRTGSRMVRSFDSKGPKNTKSSRDVDDDLWNQTFDGSAVSVKFGRRAVFADGWQSFK